MHGRNTETWNRKGIGAAERFDYLYDETELEEWTPRVQRLAEGAREVHVLFNNCHEDKGVRNAGQLGEMVGSSKLSAVSDQRDEHAQEKMM